MGSELLSSPPTQKDVGRGNNSAHSSIEDFFNSVLPYYVSIGMTIDDFWNGDPENARVFRKADEIKRERKNQEMWMTGLYIYRAIGSLSPILRTNLSKKPQSAEPYLSEPLPISKKEIERREKRDEKIRYETNIANLKVWADSINEKRGGTDAG